MVDVLHFDCNFEGLGFVKMASRLIQVQSKACEASKFVAKHGTSYYRQLLEKNKHYIQEPATVDKCQELSKQLLYTRLARSSFSLSSRDLGFAFCVWLFSVI